MGHYNPTKSALKVRIDGPHLRLCIDRAEPEVYSEGPTARLVRTVGEAF